MSESLLLIVMILLATLVTGVMYLGFGFRGTDFLFLFIVLLPAVWLGRWNLYKIEIAESPFPLLLGVLGLIWLSLLAFPDRHARLLLKAPFWKVGAPIAMLVCILLLSNFAHAETQADVMRGTNAIVGNLLALGAAWAVMRSCRIDEARIQRLVWAVLFVGTGVALMSVLTAVMPGVLRPILASQKTDVEAGRGFSTMGGPSATGMCLLLVFGLASGQLIGGRRRWITASVLVLCVVGILSTLARAALLSFIIMNLYLFAGVLRGHGRRLWPLIFVLAMVVLPVAMWFSRVYSLDRLVQMGTNTNIDTSTESRLTSMATSFRYGLRHPILGGGFGLVYPYVYGEEITGEGPPTVYIEGEKSLAKPHTLFGLIFAEGGAVALTALIWFCWACWSCIRPPHESLTPFGFGLMRGIRAAYIGFWSMCIVQDTVIGGTRLVLFTCVFFLLGCVIHAFYRNESMPYPAPHRMPYRAVPNPRFSTSWSTQRA